MPKQEPQSVVTTYVFDSTHQVMQNGDNIVGRGLVSGIGNST
jgi:hypothetical protein